MRRTAPHSPAAFVDDGIPAVLVLGSGIAGDLSGVVDEGETARLRRDASEVPQ